MVYYGHLCSNKGSQTFLSYPQPFFFLVLLLIFEKAFSVLVVGMVTQDTFSCQTFPHEVINPICHSSMYFSCLVTSSMRQGTSVVIGRMELRALLRVQIERFVFGMTTLRTSFIAPPASLRSLDTDTYNTHRELVPRYNK